jgi:methylated-DNA-protein-cysteine methyltransferase-like protein
MIDMQQIWQVAALIPVGKVASYGQVADLAGLPGRARFTSKALTAAPKSMQLPWFRILRSSGHIAFPKGSNFAIQQYNHLINEGILVKNMRVSLPDYQWTPAIGTLLFALDF